MDNPSSRTPQRLNPSTVQPSTLPYTTEQLYELSRQNDNSHLLFDGVTLSQWKSIRGFVIAGEGQLKKKNEFIARQHFLNMKSMYRRINAINRRPHLNLYRAIGMGNPGANTQHFGSKTHLPSSVGSLPEDPPRQKIGGAKGTKGGYKSEQAEEKQVSRARKSSKKAPEAKSEKPLRRPLSGYESEGGEYENVENEGREDSEKGETRSEKSVFDEELLLEKLPVLGSKSEEAKNQFKESLVEIILGCELFTEESLAKMYELTLQKNRKFKESVIENLFVEVKEFLYQQFEELQGEADGKGDENEDSDDDDK